MSSDKGGDFFLWIAIIILCVAGFIVLAIIKAIFMFITALFSAFFYFFGVLFFEYRILSFLIMLFFTYLIYLLIVKSGEKHIDLNKRYIYYLGTYEITGYFIYGSFALFLIVMAFSQEYLEKDSLVHYGILFFPVFALLSSSLLTYFLRNKSKYTKQYLLARQEEEERRRQERKEAEEKMRQKREREESYQLDMKRAQVYIDHENLSDADNFLQALSQKYPEHEHEIHQKIRDLQGQKTEHLKKKLKERGFK